MADAPAAFVWSRGALVEAELAAHETLLVADSWRVTESGRARALEAHRERFLSGVADAVAGMPAAVAAASVVGGESLLSSAEQFWEAAVSRLREHSGAALFPRVELALLPTAPDAATTPGGPAQTPDAARRSAAAGTSGGAPAGRRTELRLRMRPAPPLRETAAVMTHDGADPRTVPRRKGPDLENLVALRAVGQQSGADEVVITRDGLIVDASNAALLWWRGETLVAPSSELARVSSVTARSIRLIAAATGTRVVEERSRPADLAGCELWLVSALHGISVVELWINGPALAVRPSRAATWRRRLDALSRPL